MMLTDSLCLKISLIILWTVFVSPCTIIPDNRLRSVHLGNAPSIIPTFYNIGEITLKLFWVDTKGQEVFFHNLSPGEDFLLNSFSGHAWRLRLQSTNEVVYEVTLNENHKEDNIIEVGRDCRNTEDENEDYHVIDKSDKLAIFDTSLHFDKIYMPSSEAQLNKAFSKVPCKDILNWISRVVVVPGYHILCVTTNTTSSSDTNLEVNAWKNGYLNIPDSKRYNFIGDTMPSFREHIENILEIERNDTWYQRTSYRQQMRKTEGISKHEYMPSKWTMFDALGNELKTMENVKHVAIKQSVILVFEGGQFIYPGIDVGYKRTVSAYDKTVTLETLSLRPLLFTIDSFLSDAEMAHIIEASKPHMRKSQVSLMDKDKGRPDSDFRTSSTYFLSSKGSPLLAKIDLRVAQLTRTKLSQQEFVQVLQYQSGESYGAHTDHWDPDLYRNDDDVIEMIQGGHSNRLLTLFWYLSSNSTGGYTAFPLAPTRRLLLSPSLQEMSKLDDASCPYELKVKPAAGKVILFYSLLPDGNGDDLSQHEACPVREGVKWAANKWIWNADKNYLE